MHGHTAAEVIAARADATRPNMGLTTWAGEIPRKVDVAIAKNYLGAEELEALIHLQLVWHTPADPDPTDTGFGAGSDLDFHLRHALGDWFDQPYDCYFADPNPDWGRPGVASDDPSLDRDDTDGAGPENINLDNPETDRDYRVGVHYFNDHGYGASFATVRVFIQGVLRGEYADKRMAATDCFWEVATIHWPGGALTPIDTLSATAPNGGGRN